MPKPSPLHSAEYGNVIKAFEPYTMASARAIFLAVKPDLPTEIVSNSIKKPINLSQTIRKAKLIMDAFSPHFLSPDKFNFRIQSLIESVYESQMAGDTNSNQQSLVEGIFALASMWKNKKAQSKAVELTNNLMAKIFIFTDTALLNLGNFGDDNCFIRPVQEEMQLVPTLALFNTVKPKGTSQWGNQIDRLATGLDTQILRNTLRITLSTHPNAVLEALENELNCTIESLALNEY